MRTKQEASRWEDQGLLIGSGALPDIPASGQFTVGLWLNPSNINGTRTMFHRERSHLYIDNRVVTSFQGGNAMDTGITAPAGQCLSNARRRGQCEPGLRLLLRLSLNGTGGYIFNLKTTGYGTGPYLLNYTVSGDPKLPSVQFQVRQ